MAATTTTTANLLLFVVTTTTLLLLLLVPGGDGQEDICSQTSYPSNCTACVQTTSPPGTMDAQIQDGRALAGALIRCAKTTQATILAQLENSNLSDCVNATQVCGALIDEAYQLWTKQENRAAAESLQSAGVATTAVDLYCFHKIIGDAAAAAAAFTNLECLLLDGHQVLLKLSSASTSNSGQQPAIVISLVSFFSFLIFL